MTLKEVLSARFFRTWVVLVVLAVIAPIVSLEGHNGTAAAVVVFALASWKVRLVGLDFMELRHAPWAARAAFEAYCVVLFAVLAGGYAWL
ncbi:UNVERIFIED_CONTAM: caa(3)-type oxidase subunit IV [Williamsia faeni]